jgi:DivIVA domain-containing protein
VPELTPEAVARATFGSGFRGFDQDEVRAYLRDVADQLRDARDREADLRSQLEMALARAEAASELDEATVTQLLGEETARVITTARQAAAEIRAKAEESAARLVREAHDDAARIRGDADADADRLRAAAAAEADGVIEAAKERGRQLVTEAQAVRERVLDDLSRKRKAARAQLEQLRAGRERLLDAYGVVRRTLDETTHELEVSLDAAKVAADVAGRRAEAEPEVEPEPEPDEVAVDATDEVVADVVAEPSPEVEPPPDVELAPEVEHDTTTADTPASEIFARLREATPDPEPAPEREPEVAVDPEPEPEPTAVAVEPEPEREVALAVEPAVAPQAGADERVLERRDAATEAIEQQLSRRLKRLLADEQNDLLDRARRARRASFADIVPSEVEQAKRYSAKAWPDLQDAASAGASFFDAGNGASTEVGDLSAELASAIVVPLRSRLETAFRNAAGDDEAVADGIRATYREWKSQRLGDTARHFVLAAFTRGAYDAMPEGTCLRWVVDNGGSPCPDAEDNALAGVLDKGAAFPTGHAYPPAHAGCRCLVVPAPQ